MTAPAREGNVLQQIQDYWQQHRVKPDLRKATNDVRRRSGKSGSIAEKNVSAAPHDETPPRSFWGVKVALEPGQKTGGVRLGRAAPIEEEIQTHIGSKEPEQSRPEAVQHKVTAQTEDTVPAANNMAATARDASNMSQDTVVPLRAQFTIAQIQELQALVRQSLRATRRTGDGGREALFRWNHEKLGPLAFQIITRRDDVEIRIHSERQDTADLLEKERGVVERMITDLGLRVERFEVRVRSDSMSQDLMSQTHERENSERGRQSAADAATDVNPGFDGDTGDIEQPPPGSVSADRVWVA